MYSSLLVVWDWGGEIQWLLALVRSVKVTDTGFCVVSSNVTGMRRAKVPDSTRYDVYAVRPLRCLWPTMTVCVWEVASIVVCVDGRMKVDVGCHWLCSFALLFPVV